MNGKASRFPLGSTSLNPLDFREQQFRGDEPESFLPDLGGSGRLQIIGQRPAEYCPATDLQRDPYLHLSDRSG